MRVAVVFGSDNTSCEYCKNNSLILVEGASNDINDSVEKKRVIRKDQYWFY